MADLVVIYKRQQCGCVFIQVWNKSIRVRRDMRKLRWKWEGFEIHLTGLKTFLIQTSGEVSCYKMLYRKFALGSVLDFKTITF